MNKVLNIDSPSNRDSLPYAGVTVAVDGTAGVATAPPANAHYALVQVQVASVRMTTDFRTPVAGTTGRVFLVGDLLDMPAKDYRDALWVAETATAASLDVEFYVRAN